MKAKSNAMEDFNIFDDAILLFKKQPVLEDGDVDLFTLNDKSFLKLFTKINDSVVLNSANLDYENIVIKEEDSFIIDAGLFKEIVDF